jgi:hypothetical protein
MIRAQLLASLSALPLVAKRDLMLGVVLLLAVLIFARGIYILVKGRMRPPLAKLPKPGQVVPLASRIVLAVFHFAVATTLALLVWHLAWLPLDH